MQKTLDVGMTGNGAIAALVAITAPSGYVEFWAAPIIGIVAGILVVVAVIAIDKVLDDPVGALSAHGLAGIWGTLACGLFTSPRLAEYNGDRRSGPVLHAARSRSSACRRVGVWRSSPRCSSLSFIDLRRDQGDVRPACAREDEDAGLDITEHGMYGYPEQFIPAPELERLRRPADPDRVGARGPSADDARRSTA